MKNRFKGRLFYFVTFAYSLIIRMIQIAGEYQIRSTADDIGMLASPAYLAGYDWSSVVGYTGYYGVAYYMLFTPVLKFISDPLVVWFVIIMANLVLQSLTCVLSYHIAVHYLKYPSSLLTSLAAIICTTVVGTSSTMSQEPVLYFLTWLIVFVLLKMMEDSESRIRPYVYSVILALISAYAYLVHSRAIVFVVALFLTFVVLAYCDRSKIKCCICFVITAIVVLLLARVAQKGIIALLWKQAESGLANVNIPVSTNTIKTMLTPAGIRVLFDMFVSNLFTAAGKTFGINILAIVVGVMLVIGVKFKKCTVSITLDKRIIFIFSLTCYLMGLLGVCANWGKRVVPVYFTDNVNYYYKGFIYFRYSATFLGPAALVALEECLHNADFRAKIKLPVIISELFIVWYFFLFVVEKIRGSEFVNSAVVAYLKAETDEFDIANYRITVLFLITFTFMFFVEWRKKKVKNFVFLLCVLCSLLPYVKKGHGFIAKLQLNNRADGGYALVQYLESVDAAMTDTVYCPSKYYAWRYQFHLKEYPIVVGYPSGENREIMFYSKGKRTDDIPEDFVAVQLDNNEWVWTDDKDLYEIIVNYVSRKE